LARKFVGDFYEARKSAREVGNISWFEGATYTDQIERNPWRDKRGCLKNRGCAKDALEFDSGWNEAKEENDEHLDAC